MTAVKVQPSVTAKADVAKGKSPERTSVQKDDFTKLLQAKKDGAQQSGKTEAGKENKVADGTKTDENVVQKGQENGKEEVKAADGSKEELVASEEALQQAALQQAAAQMLIQPDTVVDMPETEAVAAAVVESAGEMAGSVATAEVVSEAVAQEDGVAQVQPKEAVAVKAAESVEEKPTVEVQTAEKPVQEAEPEKVVQTQERSDSGSHTDAKPESRPEVLTGVQTDDRRVRQNWDSQPAGQENVYSTEVRMPEQVQSPSAVGQRTEQIPLKTTPWQLPEDLGKVLASKTFETARTLTVELEPASLGKLTIRLVYEGDRASLSIMASNPRTLDILSQRASEIAAILEEKTGQETIIYTQPAQSGENPYEEEQNQNRGGEQGEQEGQKQNQGEKEHQAESFAQQLRLGLV